MVTPTEAALLLWLHNNDINYQELREGAEVIDQLTFSTERKYMATLVNSPVLNKKVLYVKGAPEIVLNKCSDALVEDRTEDVSLIKSQVDNQLLEYQKQGDAYPGFCLQGN